jgi:hypothetical protein
MPYDKPSEDALSTAYNAIAESAESVSVGAVDPADALARADQVLWLGTNRLSAMLQQHISGPWGDELIVLRDFAVDYAGQVVAALRVAIASGAVVGVVMPTKDRLRTLVTDYGTGSHGSVHVEEYGEDADQTLIEQFALPVMSRGTRLPCGARSQDELVRDSFGVVGAAADLVAAIDERPTLRRDWDF